MTTLNDRLYGRDSAAWSPPNSPNYDIKSRVIVSPADNIVTGPGQGVAHGAVPKPPDPAIGGQTGIPKVLAYNRGINPSRTLIPPFDGKVVVVPTMGVHPVVGPVGFSNRLGRLTQGTDALTRKWLPDPQTIAFRFTHPLAKHMPDETG